MTDRQEPSELEMDLRLARLGDYPGAPGVKRMADEIEALRVENERLREHISEQSGHVRTRIKDGDEIGARIWRIALEDVLHENFTTLTQTKDTTDDA